MSNMEDLMKLNKILTAVSTFEIAEIKKLAIELGAEEEVDYLFDLSDSEQESEMMSFISNYIREGCSGKFFLKFTENLNTDTRFVYFLNSEYTLIDLERHWTGINELKLRIAERVLANIIYFSSKNYDKLL